MNNISITLGRKNYTAQIRELTVAEAERAIQSTTLTEQLPLYLTNITRNGREVPVAHIPFRVARTMVERASAFLLEPITEPETTPTSSGSMVEDQPAKNS